VGKFNLKEGFFIQYQNTSIRSKRKHNLIGVFEMIVENIKIRKNQKIKVTRVCDECGKKDKTNLGVICQGRKNRKADVDLCASCASSRKYKKCKRGQNHHSWKHGLISGYKRITLEDGRRIREHRYVYEQFLNRKLIKGEVVHHIDLDTVNNDISNLILFENNSAHKKCHHISMENCALKFLNSKMWFNFRTNKYTLKYDEIFCNRDIRKINLSGYEKREWKEPCYAYINDDGKKINRRCHIVIAEKIIDRKLYCDEIVHHIDGNYLNNVPDNLIVLTRKKHFEAHHSINVCTAEFLKMGLVGFDREKKEYFVKEAA
jgi:hypothetical protein